MVREICTIFDTTDSNTENITHVFNNIGKCICKNIREFSKISHSTVIEKN